MKNDIQGAIIIIKDSLVDNSFPFKDGVEAEKIFLEKCRENISNFDSYSLEDVDIIIDEGYEKFGTGNSICIHWFNWDK